MEFFLDNLVILYNIVASIAIISNGYSDGKVQTESKESERGKEEKSRIQFNTVMYRLSVIVALLLITFFVFQNNIFFGFMILLMTYLQNTNEAYASLSVIRRIIHNRGMEALSMQEKNAIITLACALMIFNNNKVPQKIIHLSLKIPNEILSDWITTLLLYLIVTIIIFLIGVLLMFVLKKTIKVISRINVSTIKFGISMLGKTYITFQRKLKNYDFVSARFIEWIKNKNSCMNFLWVILVFMIPADLCIEVIILYFVVLLSLIEYIILIGMRICKTIKRIIGYLEAASDRKIFNIIFRIAFVVSISLIVIVNRYDPFLHNVEAGTGIMEFVASGVVIPMILSWILEYKADTKKNIE